MRPHRWQPTRLPLDPWDSPGKNTGVGCHCLLPSLYSCLQFYPNCGTCCHLHVGAGSRKYLKGLRAGWCWSHQNASYFKKESLELFQDDIKPNMIFIPLWTFSFMSNSDLLVSRWVSIIFLCVRGWWCRAVFSCCLQRLPGTLWWQDRHQRIGFFFFLPVLFWVSVAYIALGVVWILLEGQLVTLIVREAFLERGWAHQGDKASQFLVWKAQRSRLSVVLGVIFQTLCSCLQA